MYALVDCNNFFVSCERVVHPELARRPVIVLSGDDGCLVAMSNEAKALGLTRGTPLFKVRHIVEANNVVAITGNHRLYGATSARVMATLRELAPNVEVYSIDEAFLHIDHANRDLDDLGRYIVNRVATDTGIPVAVGFAPTKTLAKVAARFAKKYPGYRGAAVIDTEQKRLKALGLTAIGDVWGIGRRHGRRLNDIGITNALQFASMPVEQVRGLMTIMGERTWRELNGDPCIGPDDRHARRTITSSRTFPRDLYQFADIRRATAAFATSVGRRLRQHDSYALELSVFLMTNRYHTNEPQYYNTATAVLDEPTDDTITIANAAIRAMESIYRPGLGFKRGGITVTRLTSREGMQPSLFCDLGEMNRRSRLMHTIDSINRSLTDATRVRLATDQSAVPQSQTVNTKRTQ